jgi:hypothetical protein
MCIPFRGKKYNIPSLYTIYHAGEIIERILYEKMVINIEEGDTLLHPLKRGMKKGPLLGGAEGWVACCTQSATFR